MADDHVQTPCLQNVTARDQIAKINHVPVDPGCSGDLGFPVTQDHQTLVLIYHITT